MRLNIRLIGSIFGLVCLAFCGKFVARAVWQGARFRRGGGKNEGNAAAVALAVSAAGLAVWLLGSIGVLFGRILQAAVGRSREYLADASSVEFTRNPQAMADALATIGAVAQHGTVRSPHAEELAHLFFAQGVSSLLFATHPPLEKRIARFDPSFRGDFRPAAARVARRLAQANAGNPSAGEDPDTGDFFERAASGEDPFSAGAAAGFAAAGASAPRPAARPEKTGLAATAPEAIRTPAEAPVLLAAALLEPGEGEVRRKQLAMLEAFEADWPARARQWEERLRALPAGPARRAWCEIALTALRPRPLEERRELEALLRGLVEADGRLTAFECALVRLFKNRLLPLPPPLSECRASDLAEDVQKVLFALAHYGAPDADARMAAYRKGVAALPASFALAGTDAPRAPSSDAFGDALENLRALTPAAKQHFLGACRAVVEADGKTTPSEDHALYAIADTLAAPTYPR